MTASIKTTLNQAGFQQTKKITDTLQGSVYSATRSATSDSVVIKVTSKQLHRDSVAIIDGKTYSVQENILNEKTILKYLTIQQNSPQSILKYIDFFENNSHYYLVTQNGHSLFDFVLKVHECIKNNTISLSEYRKMITLKFKQMIECISYIYSKKVCHFDISLENFLINDVKLCDFGISSENLLINDVKLCDFGLSETFKRDNNGIIDDLTNKYKSPAMKNDVWCIGVVLFQLMFAGCAPWKKTEINVENFVKIMDVIKYSKNKIFQTEKTFNKNVYDIPEISNKAHQTFTRIF